MTAQAMTAPLPTPRPLTFGCAHCAARFARLDALLKHRELCRRGLHVRVRLVTK